MLLRVLSLAAAICLVAVLAAGRMPGLLAASGFASGPGVEPSQAAARPVANSAGRQATLRKGPGGHVVAEATVNGRTITMMVDTGASLVVLNGETARRLGYDFARSDYRLSMGTANGTIKAAPIRLRELRIGEVSLFDVDAVALPIGAMDGNLLGMSFLNRLRKFEFNGGELVLSQ